MRQRKLINHTFATVVLAYFVAISRAQAPTVTVVDEKLLREYIGTYQWETNAFVYLQMWDEFSGLENRRSSHLMNRARFALCIRQTATSSSLVRARRFRRPSSRESSFSATSTARLYP